MPAHLSPEAQAVWHRQGPELACLGLLTSLDRSAFSADCSAWSTHVEAQLQIALLGAVVAGDRGALVVNPWCRVSRQAAELMARLLGEFGMTPAARTRINALPPSPAGSPGDFEFCGAGPRPLVPE